MMFDLFNNGLFGNPFIPIRPIRPIRPRRVVRRVKPIEPIEIDLSEFKELINSLVGEPPKNMTTKDLDDGSINNDENGTTSITNHANVKEPPSILDKIDNGATLDDALNEFKEIKKSPFVFVANNLTFIIKTRQPVIFDTSCIHTPSEDCIFVAIDEKKTFPKVTLSSIAKMAHEINCDDVIQDEIKEFLLDTEWKNIYCVPHVMDVNGTRKLGFMFAISHD